MSDDFKMDLSAEIEAARKKRVGSFKLDIEQSAQNTENEAEEIEDKKSDSEDIQDNNGEFDIDTEAPARMMADDFSEKYSLHKYTDADQIDESDSVADEEFDGEERAVVDSDEISSFSNLEQKHRMDKEERKAIKAYKKSDKKRQKEKAEKNSAMFRTIWFCMVLSVSVVLGMFLWNGASDLLGISRPEDGETIIIEVPENANFEQIISLLTENDLIKEENFFRLYATFTNSTDGFEDGIKTMRPNMDYEEILNTLQSGPMRSETVTVQFKEGMSVRQVAEALEDKKVCKAEKFMELCNSDMFDEEYTFLAEIPKNENCVYKLEGYLFPDTYEFYIGEDAEDSIRRFLDNFEYKICTSTSTVSGYTDAVSIETIIKDKGMTINDVIKINKIKTPNKIDSDVIIINLLSPPIIIFPILVKRINSNPKPINSKYLAHINSHPLIGVRNNNLPSSIDILFKNLPIDIIKLIINTTDITGINVTSEGTLPPNIKRRIIKNNITANSIISCIFLLFISNLIILTIFLIFHLLRCKNIFIYFFY